jgi:hypothetical protein
MIQNPSNSALGWKRYSDGLPTWKPGAATIHSPYSKQKAVQFKEKVLSHVGSS